MKQEELKTLESLLWEFRVQYSDELSESELRSIIKVIKLLTIKIKNYGSNKVYSNLRK